MVNPKVWQEVPNKHVPSTVGLRKVDKSRNSESNTKIREQDQLPILSLIKRRRRVKVVHTTKPPILLSDTASLLLQLVVVVPSNIGNKI